MQRTERVFFPGIQPRSPAGRLAVAWWFAFRGGELLLHVDADVETAIPRVTDLSELSLAPNRATFLGELDGSHVYAVELPDTVEPPRGLTFRALRQLYGVVDEQLFNLAGRASQILEWERTHRFCGRCGTETEYATTERAKRCPACGHLSFPRLSPAVITLVERGDEVLLARHTRTTDGTYALLAGFVEPGESMEEAVRREIREETGVHVDRIAYFGSQPWPFPHQLMIGFTAQYASGDIEVDGEEIADAHWFSAHALPKVPMKLSIARKLIDAYAAKHSVTIDQP
jgi:NAD+ diphosphatase